MSIEKEELSREIETNHYRNSNFGFLWESLSSQFDFQLIRYETPTSPPTDDDAPHLLYTPKEHEKIIYHNATTQEIMIIKHLTLFNQVYTVRDQLEPNRYFIGFTHFVHYSNLKTIGMIVYLDDKGAVAHKKVFVNILCESDVRDGNIQTFLYNQTLLFTQIHRDSRAWIMNLVLLSHEDEWLASNCFYVDHIKCRNRLNANPVLHRRFVQVVTSKTTYLIDLASTRIQESSSMKGGIRGIFSVKTEQKKQLALTLYKVDNEDKLDEAIKHLSESESESESYGDGYPNHCITCGKTTSKAIYAYSNSDYSSETMGWGNGYCINCQIRFSKSEQLWVCCRLSHPNNTMCSQVVTSQHPCTQPHSRTHQLAIYSEDKPLLKYPYKKQLHITTILI